MNHKSLLFLSLFLGTTIFTSCTSVDYNGKTYPPTTKVKIYYSKERIPQKYTIIGKATVSTWYSYQNTSLKPALIEKAKACGADAILINSIGESISTTARVASNNEMDNGTMAANNPGLFNEDAALIPRTDGNQTTVSVDKSNIVADFLKFQK